MLSSFTRILPRRTLLNELAGAGHLKRRLFSPAQDTFQTVPFWHFHVSSPHLSYLFTIPYHTMPSLFLFLRLRLPYRTHAVLFITFLLQRPTSIDC